MRKSDAKTARSSKTNAVTMQVPSSRRLTCTSVTKAVTAAMLGTVTQIALSSRGWCASSKICSFVGGGVDGHVADASLCAAWRAYRWMTVDTADTTFSRSALCRVETFFASGDSAPNADLRNWMAAMCRCISEVMSASSFDQTRSADARLPSLGRSTANATIGAGV